MPAKNLPFLPFEKGEKKKPVKEKTESDRERQGGRERKKQFTQCT